MSGPAPDREKIRRDLREQVWREQAEECRLGISHAYTLELFDSLLARLEAAERERDEERRLRLISVKPSYEALIHRAETAEAENERLREALERVLENARSWHGPAESDNGHAKALIVIANWCADALDARTEESA